MSDALALIDGLAGIAGVHIRVRHDLPAASMRLMQTLGVVVTVDPDAPDCERRNSWDGQPGRCRHCAGVDRDRAKQAA